MVMAALAVGAGFGYLMPRSATGKEGRSLLPMVFEKGMEVFTGTSHTYVPREPSFVSEGNCRLSGLAKFFPPTGDDSQVVRLGYALDLEAPSSPDSVASWPYNAQFSFALLDADGFPVRYVRTGTQRLNPGESSIFQGILEEPIPCDIAARTKKVECRLCFEGIEIP
jgi:hypothetical protein